MNTNYLCNTPKIKKHTVTFSILCIALLLINCSKNDVETPAPAATPPRIQHLLTTKSNNATKFWNKGATLVSILDKQSQTLQRTSNTLLMSPTSEALAETQEEWRNMATTVEQLQFYFQLAEVAPNHFEQLYQAQKNLASKPIQPGYLDSFKEYPYSGIVHDIGFELSIESLRQQNRSTDEEEVLLGIYAIQYLLFSNNNRISTDFNVTTELNEKQRKAGLLTPQELPSNRRNTLLSLQIKALMEDIALLNSIWITTDTTELQPITLTWDALPADSQSAIIKSTIETNIAKLMLRVVEIKQLTDEDNNELNPNIRSKLKALAVSLNASIQALSILLPEQKEREIDSLTQARQHVKTLQDIYAKQTSSLQTDENKPLELLQQVYQHIQEAVTPTYIPPTE